MLLRARVIGAIVAGVVAWAWPAVAAPATRTVLTVHWGAEDFPANAVMDAGIREVLLAPSTDLLDYYAEYLESDRFSEETASDALRDYIHRKYAGRHIDLVIANTDPALRFVLRHRADLFPDAPIVFVGVEAPQERLRHEGAGLAAVLRGGFAETMRLALELHPSTRQVFVVAEVPTFSLANSALAELQPFERQVALTYLTEGPLPRLLEQIRAAPPRSLVLYIRYSQEVPGKVVIPSEVVRLVAAASPVPVYGTSEVYVGAGALGGAVYTLRGLGVRAAEIARQILDGKSPRDIAVERAPLTPTFDWRQMRRWGIAPSQLPSGSDIRFMTPTVWELYRWYIVAAISVVTVQALLIGGLLVERVWRRRAEREAQRTRESLAHLTRVSAMGELAASLAHELNQPLTGILSNARAARRRLDAGSLPTTELQEILADIVEDDKRAADVITRMRELVTKRPTERAAIDFHEVVERIVQLMASDSIIRQVELTLDLAPAAAPVEGDRVQLQQVILNLVLNALEAASLSHENVHHVRISTELHDRDVVHLLVSDNGPGVKPGDEWRVFEAFYTTKGSGMGMGLAIARSIVESHGGRIWCTNGRIRGAEFHVVLPRLAHAPTRWLARRSA